MVAKETGLFVFNHAAIDYDDNYNTVGYTTNMMLNGRVDEDGNANENNVNLLL